MFVLTRCVLGAAAAGMVTIAPLSAPSSQAQEKPAWTIIKPEPTWPRKSAISARLSESRYKAKSTTAKRAELASRKDDEASRLHQRKLAKRGDAAPDKTDAAASKSETALVHPPHHVVIQVSQNDPAVMNMALNNAENLTKYYRDKGEQINIEVVAYGPGLHMLRSDTSPVKVRLGVLAMDNTTFSACGNTLNAQSKQEGKEITLVPEARIVPAGIARIMELQEQHWTYVRP
jgi:intracellular sulfur oxidation DsrE/DsrF family protein